jgi:hypothetical protein
MIIHMCGHRYVLSVVVFVYIEQQAPVDVYVLSKATVDKQCRGARKLFCSWYCMLSTSDIHVGIVPTVTLRSP